MKTYLLIAALARREARNRLDVFVQAKGGYVLDPSACWWVLPHQDSPTEDSAAAIRADAAQLIAPEDRLIVIEVIGGWSSTGLRNVEARRCN